MGLTELKQEESSKRFDLPMRRNIVSHSMPEGFRAALGFKPLVTAWDMTAWRFSFSRAISRSCSVTNVSIFRRLLIQKCGYAGLLRQRRQVSSASSDVSECNCLPHSCPKRFHVE